jgi:hypothetical protein
MFNVIRTALTARSIRIWLTTTILVTTLSGCAIFQPPCGADCEAKYLCNGLNQRYYNNENAFKLAKHRAKNPLAKNFCVWRKGLVLPEDTLIPKDNPPSPDHNHISSNMPM